MQRKVKIEAVGSYIPKNPVNDLEIDKLMGLKEGSSYAKSGIKNRFYSDCKEESQSQMAAYAVMSALEKCNLKFSDIDALICSSGTGEQELPSTASLILEKLNYPNHNITAFDINSTCLSFVTALDTISYMVDAGRFERVVIVSSEIASIGLDYKHLEACSLFGDGAAAVVISKTPANENSKILNAQMAVYPEGAHDCELVGGGSLIHPKDYKGNEDQFYFRMNGKKVFKLASTVVPPFINGFFQNSNISKDEIKLFIPHQASVSGMALIRKKLEIPEEKWMNIIEQYGNMISASIPLSLGMAIDQNKILRGDKVCLMGTSAGFGIGALILEF